MEKPDSPLVDAIDNAVDTNPLGLRDALLAVVKRHQPIFDRPRPGQFHRVCVQCRGVWPCTTLQDIAEHVGVDRLRDINWSAYLKAAEGNQDG